MATCYIHALFFKATLSTVLKLVRAESNLNCHLNITSSTNLSFQDLHSKGHTMHSAAAQSSF